MTIAINAILAVALWAGPASAQDEATDRAEAGANTAAEIAAPAAAADDAGPGAEAPADADGAAEAEAEPSAAAPSSDGADDAGAAETGADAEAEVEADESAEGGGAAPGLAADAERRITRQRAARRLEALMREPAEGAEAVEVQQRLDAISRNAAQLAALSDDRALRLRAMTVQMQALYRRLVELPDAADADRWLVQLRAAARRTKALVITAESPPGASPDAKDPETVGDYWLMIANLVELNRLNLPDEAHRAQARSIMRTFLDRHRDAKLADQVRPAYRALQPTAKPDAAGPETEAPEAPEVRQAPDAPATPDGTDGAERPAGEPADASEPTAEPSEGGAADAEAGEAGQDAERGAAEAVDADAADDANDE